MVISVNLLFTKSVSWLEPLRYKNGKLLVMGGNRGSGSPVPGNAYIGEYDLTTTPPTLLRERYFPNNQLNDGWTFGDTGYFDEESQVAVIGAGVNHLIAVRYSDFTQNVVYTDPNIGYFVVANMVASKLTDSLYFTNGNNIVKTQLSQVLNFGSPTFTVLPQPPSPSGGNYEVQVVYWKGKLWALVDRVRYGTASSILSYTTDDSTWTTVRQTQGDPNYLIPGGQLLFGEMVCNEDLLAYSYFSQHGTFVASYTRDGSSFVDFDTGVNLENQTGEYNGTLIIAGKYLVVIVSSEALAGVQPSLNIYKMWIIDTKTGTLIGNLDLSGQISLPAHTLRNGLVTEDGKILFSINVIGGSYSSAGIAQLKLDVTSKITLALSGNVLTATLTDINNNPISGKALRAKQVKHIVKTVFMDTNILTGTTDNTGKVTFTLPSSGWWVVEYNGD